MPEIQDLYDAPRSPTGERFIRGDQLPRGRYRLGVQVWLQNDDGRFLLTQRHPSKKKPLMWEPTGGSVRAGEDTLSAGLRELREEIGVALQADALSLIRTDILNDNEFLDIYLARWNGSTDDLTLQSDEVVDARWAGHDDLLNMDQRGQLAYDWRYLFDPE